MAGTRWAWCCAVRLCPTTFPPTFHPAARREHPPNTSEITTRDPTVDAANDADDSLEASSGRRVAARDSRAGEEDWTKRKKQNKTSKAEEAVERRSNRRAKARRVEAGLRRK
ncbi:uncharacterized protein LOC100870790 isoform X2 [Apis florea]|uniref:uncharacterized protein LOC100870790 isoform X2 n=1 Tax=Apis florea TaxID=7463 RepID=UPI0012FEB413|nr:uncharacterized protein LOC100870790 isoform X2 [Apis florea]